MTKDLSLLDFIILLLKHRKRVVVHFLCIAVASVGISMVLPKYYKSTVVFLPPGQSGSGLLSFFGSSISADLVGSSKFSKRQYIALLQSREIREKLVKEFDLIKIYKQDKFKNGLDRTLKFLDKELEIKETEEGGLGITDVVSISIAVTDRSPQRASEMANYLLKSMEDKALELSSIEYGSVVAHLEKATDECEKDLETARANLKEFQIKNKVYDVPSQTGIVMQALGGVTAELMMLEKQRSFLQGAALSNFPEIRKLDKRIGDLQRKITEMEERKTVNILPGLQLSLDLGNTYLDLLKEVETYIQVRFMLRQQLELSKVRAERDYSGIYVVDRARPAQYKYKPKRAVVVLGIVGVYMVLLIGFLFIREHYRITKQRAPERLARIDELLATIRAKKAHRS